VTEWLERRGHAPKQDAGETNVWAALNALRGELSADEAAELVLALAVQRKTGERDDHLSSVDAQALARVRAAIDRVDAGNLASAADFVLERLYRSQGKVGADFGFVGSRTTTLLASLAAARPGAVLYDPACGIGAALLKAVELGARPSRVVGHDINAQALHVAAQRATLHGVDVELSLTDVLSEDLDPGLLADVIILEPPFGLRFDGPLRLTDARFDFGTPPRASADTAWIQHSVAHLTEQGRAYVLSPAGALFRGGEEAKIRTELVRRGSVEAIVGLPGKLLPHTSIPLALWVLRRPLADAAPERLLFIDASESVAPENRVAAWLNDPAARNDIPHAEVATADVLAAESVLTPQRWVDRTERDPEEVARTYTAGWVEISDTMRKLQNILSSFEQFAAFSKARVMTVGELIEQGVLDLRVGKPKDRYDNVPTELRDRIVTAADVRDGRLHDIGLDHDYPSYPELTVEGDVLVTTMNTVRARVDESGGHLPSTGVHRLRVQDHNVLSPSYLALALTGSWNERFQGGSTIQRASVRDLEVPLLPISEQRDIRLSALSLSFLREEAARLVDQTSRVGTALLDAVRYNVPLPTSTSTAAEGGQSVRQEDAHDMPHRILPREGEGS
jgi:SAM-dependent methyltransferase